jgi:hypothetical protein
MTITVALGMDKAAKKAYMITITEREMKNGKVTGRSINNMSFQVRDYSGESTLLSIRDRLMYRLASGGRIL